ncbi:hypothetical protein LTR95_014567 [Oleoguttula sp. CCFEE 5521]
MSHATATSGPALLRLPTELHDKILGYVFDQGACTLNDRLKALHFRMITDDEAALSSTAPLLINKSLYESALAVLYKSAVFNIMVLEPSARQIIGNPPIRAPSVERCLRVVLQVGTSGHDDDSRAVQMAQTTMDKLTSAERLSHIHIAYMYLDSEALTNARSVHACVKHSLSAAKVTMSWADMGSIGLGS